MSRLTGMHRLIIWTCMIALTHLDLCLLLDKKAWLPFTARVKSVRPTLIWRDWRCRQPPIFGIRGVGAAAKPPQPHGTEPRLHWKMGQDAWASSGVWKSYCPVGEGVFLPSQSLIISRNGQTMSPKLFVSRLCLHSSPFFFFPGDILREAWHWTITLEEVQLNLCYDDRKL